MSVAGTAVYNDFQSLAELRTKAGNNPEEAIVEVAKQFESLFVQMMLKSMRDATVEGGLFDSDQMETYQSMFDQQLSLDVAGQGGLGLSAVLVEQLGGNKPLVDAQQAPQPLVSISKIQQNAQRNMLNLYSGVQRGAAAANGFGSQGTSLVNTASDRAWTPSSPEEYIRGVWEHAVDAASELGLDPEVLVAQSALETGWGKQVISAAGGQSSFNLFGVKAGAGWDGKFAAVDSIEFRDGVAVRERSSFRVYDSLADSFSDYVDFLKSNPRYQQALEEVGDSRQFLLELQDAGYATDPRYAEKIMGIVDRVSVDSVISELKNLPVMPLSS